MAFVGKGAIVRKNRKQHHGLQKSAAVGLVNSLGSARWRCSCVWRASPYGPSHGAGNGTLRWGLWSTVQWQEPIPDAADTGWQIVYPLIL
jgi:hypothetical protein